MTKLRPWVKLPSVWIEDGGLRQFRWRNGGADNIAALMTLAVIAHHADPGSGVARLTYTALADMTSRSRAKVRAGLALLTARELIEKTPEGRSSYGLRGYNPAAEYAVFPAKGLYENGVVSIFRKFHLRQPAELYALKLLYLFAARRSRETNMAKISYEKIEEYSGVARNRIPDGLTVLGVNGLVRVYQFGSELSEHGVANAYRLSHLQTRRHMGTTGRSLDEFGFAEAE